MKTVKSTAALVTGVLLAGQAHAQNTPPAIPAPATPAATNAAPPVIPPPPSRTPAPAPANPTVTLPQTTATPPAFPAFPTVPAFTNRLANATNALPAASTNRMSPQELVAAAAERARARAAASGAQQTLVPPPGVAGAMASTPSTAGASASDPASVPAKEEAIYEYKLAGGTLEILIAEYIRLVGKIPLRSGPTAANKVDGELKVPFNTPPGVKLTRTEAIIYLETIMAMNGISLVPLGDKFVKIVPEASVATSAPEFSKLTSEQLPLMGNIVQHIVQLKFVAVQDVLTAIQAFAKTPGSIVQIPSTQTLILRDNAENVKRMLEMIEKIDVAVPMEVKPEVIPIKYALAADIQSVIGTLTPSGAGATVGQSRSSTLGRPAGSTSGLPGMSGVGGVGGSSTFGASRLGTTTSAANPFAAAGASGAGSTAFASRINSIISRAAGGGDFQILGSVKIIADERTNSLLVFASDQDMVMIKDIISKLDVVLAQVLIESIILEVSTNDSLNYGVSAGGRRSDGKLSSASGMNNGQTFPTGTNATSIINNLPGGFSYFGSWGNDLDVAVTAISANGTVNVLSRPRVQTSHAVPATLKIGSTVPYVTGNFANINGGNTAQYQQTFVGIDLQVTPLINPDGLVVMDIVQDIQQLGTPTQIDGNDVPTTTQRAASAKVAVRDRETIILGGFMSKSQSKSKSGVPILKDIPGLGALFRSTGNSGQQVELMVLIRPTVLPTPEAAAITAAEQRDQMPGIKRAEAETREDERRREKEADKILRKRQGSRDGG